MSRVEIRGEASQGMRGGEWHEEDVKLSRVSSVYESLYCRMISALKVPITKVG